MSVHAQVNSLVTVDFFYSTSPVVSLPVILLTLVPRFEPSLFFPHPSPPLPSASGKFHLPALSSAKPNQTLAALAKVFGLLSAGAHPTTFPL